VVTDSCSSWTTFPICGITFSAKRPQCQQAVKHQAEPKIHGQAPIDLKGCMAGTRGQGRLQHEIQRIAREYRCERVPEPPCQAHRPYGKPCALGSTWIRARNFP
jgi:hypothetical protein